MKLADLAGVEIKGAYFSTEGGNVDRATHMTIGMYKDNKHTQSISSGHTFGINSGLRVNDLGGFFHTHPGKNLYPGPTDLKNKSKMHIRSPQMRLFILTHPEYHTSKYYQKREYTHD